MSSQADQLRHLINLVENVQIFGKLSDCLQNRKNISEQLVNNPYPYLKNVKVMKNVTESDVDKCVHAVLIVYNELKKRNLENLLSGEIRIAYTPDKRSQYDTLRDIIYLDAAGYNKQDTAKSLMHEIGHRLNYKLSLWPKMKIIWAHFTAKSGWHPNQYSRQNHQEMWAELFRHYMAGWLSPQQESWIEKIIDQARQAGKI